MDRNLDGFYLRVKDGEKFVNKCFTDLTLEQKEEFLSTLNEEGLKRMVLEFAEIIKQLGDEFDIKGE